MLKIRLTKTGKKNAPSFRVVVTDSRRPRDGAAIDILGYYNPSNNPPLLEINKKGLKGWLEKGAQTTEAVEKLIKGKYEFKPYTRAAKSAEVGYEKKDSHISDNSKVISDD